VCGKKQHTYYINTFDIQDPADRDGPTHADSPSTVHVHKM
jgi:hypothetical protein